MKKLFFTLIGISALPLTFISIARADIYDDLQRVFLADDQILYDETMSTLEPQLDPLQIAYNESELSYNSLSDEYNLLIARGVLLIVEYRPGLTFPIGQTLSGTWCTFLD